MPRPTPLPLFYRLTLSYIEPLLAIGGALQALLYPQSYLDYVTPRTRYTNSLDPLFSQIVGGWCIIVYLEFYALPHGESRTLCGSVRASSAD